MNKSTSIHQIKNKINNIDIELIKLLSTRRKLNLSLCDNKDYRHSSKKENTKEQQDLERLIEQGKQESINSQLITQVFKAIFKDTSIEQQKYSPQPTHAPLPTKKTAIAYLGNKGSYSHSAVNQYCQTHQLTIQEINCHSFDDIINKVNTAQAEYGFLPIENTSSGSINEVFDLLQHTNLMIVAETTIDVSHCLLVKPNTKKSQIKQLFAHPQPISQCSQYLSQFPNIKLEYSVSSADAMRQVQTSKNNDSAAIGSAYGAQFFGLEAIERNLANQKINQTRFIVVAKNAAIVPQHIEAKTSLIIATNQQPGALVDALSVFKSYQLNMSKLESRPIIGKPWQEMFYLDIDVNFADPKMVTALAELSKLTRFMKVLGCYPLASSREV